MCNHIDKSHIIKMMALAKQKAGEFSTDQSTKVGCVIYNPDTHEIITVGTNHHTHGIDVNDPHVHTRPAKYKFTEHAERNLCCSKSRTKT